MNNNYEIIKSKYTYMDAVIKAALIDLKRKNRKKILTFQIK